MLPKAMVSGFIDELSKIAEAKPSTVPDSLPAREANSLFFKPDKNQNPSRKVTLVDSGSAAKQMSREDMPIDAQSTANVAASNQISPAYGPGVV